MWTNWPINLSGNVFGYNHREKNQFFRFLRAYTFINLSKLHQVATTFEINGREASQWYKIWWITYNVNKLDRRTYLVMYLVTIIKKKTEICRFLLAYKFMQVESRCPDFQNKWSWGLCVIPIWCMSYNVNKLTHISYLVMYLVTMIKMNTKICRFFPHK